MENFNHVCKEMEKMNKEYLKHENKIYLETMEESWVNIITNGKLSFNNFSYLSAFEINF